MRLSSLLILFVTFASAALLSLVAASLSADLIEDSSRSAVERELSLQGMDWAEVHAEGLQVFMAGVAPTEADRFKALSAAGSIVDAARVIDNMQVPATAAIAPPRFSVEILRNDSGISLIGLIPASADRAAMVRQLKTLTGAGDVADLLETADYDAPQGWASATRYALSALEDLPRSKISVQQDRVDITAMAESPDARSALENDLTRRIPAGLEVNLAISAPRPVITPFTLRFLKDEAGARFDACSADTDKARTEILTAARAAGLMEDVDCVIGLGVPSTQWGTAATLAIRAINEIGGGSVTFSDADLTLTAPMGTSQAFFDTIVGELEADLPEAFALLAILPPTPETEEDSVAPEFTATLSPEGLLQMRGRLPNEIARDTTDSYARARFGSDAVYMAARLDDSLPPTWPFRVMAGLDALSVVHNGVLMVTEDSVSVSGQTGETDANARITQMLAEKLSQTDHYAINVTYVEALDPLAGLPTAEDCMAVIQTLQNDTKITFEPGKSTLDESAAPIIDALAEQVDLCPDLRLEIQGHTDSQGRESMNQALSQTRALAVLTALQDRRVLTKGFLALGYGESQPIADNDTEEGREANRRIEFVRILTESDSTTEQSSEPAQASATTSETATETASEGSETQAPSSEQPSQNAASDQDAAAPATTEEQPPQDPAADANADAEDSAESETNDAN